MINHILGYIDDLRSQTEMLEALNWDNELLTEFMDELRAMLMAAPPNVDKALFWLKNTPWDCFDGGALPSQVAIALENCIRNTEQEVLKEVSARKDHLYALPPTKRKNDDTEWN